MLIYSIGMLPYKEALFIENQFVKLVEVLDKEDRDRLLEGRLPAHAIADVLQHRSRGLEDLSQVLWVDYSLTGMGYMRREIAVQPRVGSDSHYSHVTLGTVDQVPPKVMERMQVEHTTYVRLRPFG